MSLEYLASWLLKENVSKLVDITFMTFLPPDKSLTLPIIWEPRCMIEVES